MAEMYDVFVELHMQLNDCYRDTTGFSFDIFSAKDDVKIGEGKGYLMEVWEKTKKDITELADEIDGDIYEMFRVVNPDTLTGCSGYYLGITRIKIDEEYRGKDYGVIAMKHLLNHFGKFMGCIAIITPHPIHGTSPESETKKGINKLRAHWEKCGFKQYKKSQVFYKELDYI